MWPCEWWVGAGPAEQLSRRRADWVRGEPWGQKALGLQGLLGALGSSRFSSFLHGVVSRRSFINPGGGGASCHSRGVCAGGTGSCPLDACSGQGPVTGTKPRTGAVLSLSGQGETLEPPHGLAASGTQECHSRASLSSHHWLGSLSSFQGVLSRPRPQAGTTFACKTDSVWVLRVEKGQGPALYKVSADKGHLGL